MMTELPDNVSPVFIVCTPGLQKMSDQTLIQILVSQILKTIFGFIPAPDRFNFLGICRRWYKILDEEVGVEVNIGRGQASTPTGAQFSLVKVLGQVGISTCNLVAFINNDPRGVPALKHPNLLRDVKIKGFLSSASFESLLSPKLVNLKRLQLDHTALATLEFFDIEVNLHSLETLEIVESGFMRIGNGGGAAFEEESVFSSKYGKVHTNTAHLCTKLFPGLRNLKVVLPFLESTDAALTNGLLQLLTNHAETLTNLEVDLERNRRIERLNSATPPPASLPQNINFAFKPRSNSKLEKIELYFPMTESVQNLELWEEFLTQPTKLSHLSLKGCFSQRALHLAVSNSGPTLTSVKLNWLYRKRGEAGPELAPLDCSMFRTCGKLEEVRLLGDWHAFMENGGDGNEPNTGPGLHNVKFLSNNIRTITVTSVPLDAGSCHDLLLKSPALRALKLINVAGRFGLGVNVNTLRDVVQRKQLEMFKVDLGFGDAHERDLFQICAKSRHTNYSVRAFRHPDGSYRNEPTPGYVEPADDWEGEVEHVSMQFIGEN
jgi:hypothetical protein